MMTRRDVEKLLLAAPLSLAGAAGRTPIDDLHLDAATLEQLTREAERAIEQARWLQDLPLEGVVPGFVFVPL
jgi:hypothetical protein